MAIARVVLVVLLTVLAGCRAAPERPAVQTLAAGVLKIAVTGTTVTDSLNPEEWMYRYAERLGRDLSLRVEYHVVPPGLTRSGKLARLVATTSTTSLPASSHDLSNGTTWYSTRRPRSRPRLPNPEPWPAY